MADPRVVVGRGRTADVSVLSDSEVAKVFFADRPEQAVAGEFERAALAWSSGLPTPRPIRREAIDGRPAIVFERVQGASMLEMLPKQPWKLARFAGTLAGLAREIHSVDGAGMRTVVDYVKARLRGADLQDSVRRRLLDEAAKMPKMSRVCHLDFHPDNVLMSSSGPMIIDWANAAQGDPAADIAQSLILLRCAAIQPWQPFALLLRAGRRGFAVLFERDVMRGDGDLRARVNAWMPVMAGARLAEGQSGERDALLRVIVRTLG